MGDIGNAISGAINSVEHALGDAAQGNLGGAINDLGKGASGAVGGLINGFMGASPDPGVLGGLSGVLGGLSKSGGASSGGVSVSTAPARPNPFSPGSLPGNISQDPLQGLGGDQITKLQQKAQAIQQAIANEKGSQSISKGPGFDGVASHIDLPGLGGSASGGGSAGVSGSTGGGSSAGAGGLPNANAGMGNMVSQMQDNLAFQQQMSAIQEAFAKASATVKAAHDMAMQMIQASS
jgi:hypothetical protein